MPYAASGAVRSVTGAGAAAGPAAGKSAAGKASGGCSFAPSLRLDQRERKGSLSSTVVNLVSPP